MKVETISHESGDQLPILLDRDGMPIPAPNEFLISRRYLSPNTLARNARELLVFYLWLNKEGICLKQKIMSERFFSEAEFKGGLIEFLRKEHSIKEKKVRKLAISPSTFNHRLLTIRMFLTWYLDVVIVSLPFSSKDYERLLANKSRIIGYIDREYIASPPTNKSDKKGLTRKESDYLIQTLKPDNFYSNRTTEAVRNRNYVMTMIMLYYGLRPGELLSLRVDDIEIGAISCIRVTRRPSDPEDKRSPRPQIKRNGRVLIIEDPVFAKSLNDYVTEWRDTLEENSDDESEYLFLNDEGKPLSQSSITQFFRLLRQKNVGHLPSNLSAKSLRHTFSSEMERALKYSGVEEDNRRKALAYLRGDSSLSSQDIYLDQEVERQAHQALKTYHSNLQFEDIPW
ncbi:MAG: site-specific integrase [Thalassotalea sp.]|nr:site-specific integrase [Thalassotalea sp.]